jgi:hypothetical protein
MRAPAVPRDSVAGCVLSALVGVALLAAAAALLWWAFHQTGAVG